MKRTAVFFIFALLFSLASCDTTETTTIRIATGSATRAPSEVTHVRLAAYTNSIVPGKAIAVIDSPVGGTVSMVVPAGQDIEIFAGALMADGVMAPYFGTGSYQDGLKAEPGLDPKLVQIFMEQVIFTFDYVQFIDGPTPVTGVFAVNWMMGSFPSQIESTQLLKMMVLRGVSNDSETIPSEEQMSILTAAEPGVSTGFYNDATYSSAGNYAEVYYWYAIKLAVPTLGLFGASPNAMSCLHTDHPDNI